MRKNFLYCFFTLLLINALFTGCKKDLTVIPNSLLESGEIYTDKNLITSVLARFYQQINAGGQPNAASSPNALRGWGQNNDDWNKFQQDPDDGINNNGAQSTGNLTWGRDRYRALDYALIRRMNQFLAGIRSDVSRKAMTAAENANFEAQVIFLRAYVYFWMTRTLGGMTIVGDEIFTYEAGQDITPYRMPRNSEADCYQYIINQCDSAAARFTYAATVSNNATYGTAATTNASVANKWAALMLKARAAITAASIAKYTPLRAPGNVKKDARGVDVVGIPASKAEGFYTIAMAAADSVIKKSPYVLMTNASNPELAYYNATTIKTGNTEVIWATDRKLGTPANTQFTRHVSPVSPGHHDGQAEGNSLGATLNLVESFENRDGSDPKIIDKNPDGTFVIYDDVEMPFKAKDARLWGTVIWPNALFRGTPVPLRAGEIRKITLPYTAPSPFTVSAPQRTAVNGITGPNGPADVSTNFVNKTGFGVRKWLDETPNSGIAPNYSEVWWPRFRIAEAYMIGAEAAFELNKTTDALTYINKIRTERGRIQPLTAADLTFDKIVNENRVEFAFEDHRVWDLIRWRLAHVLWNGINDDPNAQPMALYAYRINVLSGDQSKNGKWVFERKKAWRRVTTPFNFPQEAYYSGLDLDWVNPKNPNWVLNPYQQ